MKVNIEIECSPEEARQFMGLPDVEKANSVYVDAVVNAMKGVQSTDQLQEYAQQLAPMGQVGLKIFQCFMNAATQPSSGSSTSSSSSSAPGRARKSDD